jgi:hypothetical protein
MRTPGEFAAALFGHDLAEGCYVHTWALRGKRSAWWRSTQGLNYLTGREDVFIGAALAGADHGPGRRIRAKDAIAIPGAWIDVDVNGAPKNNGTTVTDGAPDLDAAIDLAHAVLEPTLVVSSGHGLHAWHLLPTPWLFRSVDEQSAGTTLAAQWVAVHQREAQRRGFKIDSVGDLARLMRPPGTLNTKGGHRNEVRTIAGDGPRYELSELADKTRGVVATCPPISLDVERASIAELRISRANTPPVDLLEALIANSPEFAEVWFRARAEFGDDQSAYDLALANFAVAAGWADQQIANLIGYHRGWDEKCFRTGRIRGQHGYLAATIARARESQIATAA